MLLRDRPLTDPVDRLYEQQIREHFHRLKATRCPDGTIRQLIRDDHGEKPFFECKTYGETEFVLFSVYLAKIRRENRALGQATHEERVQWCELADQFVQEFGERAPPDIKRARDSFREHLGI